MKSLNNRTYQILGAIVLIIIAAWLFAKKPFNNPQTNTPPSNQTDTPQTAPPNSEPAKDGNQTQTGTRTIEGVLKISDDLKQGNLMLKTVTTTIYIFTSRDFSSFLDKQVLVSYQGNLDNFVLQDITQK